MAAADFAGGRRRFAVACGVLSRCVKAEAAAGKMCSAASIHPTAVATAASTMLLMPGADVVPDVREEKGAKLTIMYGGRVLVFDEFPAGSAAELVRIAAGAGQDDVHHGGSSSGLAADLPVARKASLQRFMEKRRGRLGATAPYSPRRLPAPLAANAAKEDGDAAGCWLVLGTPGSGRAVR
ncbi:hypothetical protein E2562_017725 [Oryza meyeriana var. granulata]|uniref:Protein TIFY n=1 Tax=Oryza meyeriana var. granulata TaxID=110450 RepID=A0A6G1BY01_9ORYZ|nr:hypothetical protein E2562_017725 [Oryza meyeriana var. granulata]